MSVHRIRLIEEFLRALGKVHLIHAHNFCIETVDVVRFLGDSECLDSPLLGRFILLEVAFHLEGAISALSNTEAIWFALIPRCSRPSIMVHKSVGMGRLGGEASRNDQFYKKNAD